MHEHLLVFVYVRVSFQLLSVTAERPLIMLLSLPPSGAIKDTSGCRGSC